MRALVLALALVGVGCGSLYDALPDAGRGQDAGASQDAGALDAGATGLFCASDDPCICEVCTTTSQCAPTLQCLTARRHGSNCPDNRRVCTTGP